MKIEKKPADLKDSERKIEEPSSEQLSETSLKTVSEEKKEKKTFSEWKALIKQKIIPPFVKKWKANREAAVLEVDLSRLPKPVNDAATSGPKKMKDFTAWARWKSLLVGVIGIIAVIAIWWIYASVTEANGGTSFLSSPATVWERLTATIENGILWRHLSMSLSRVAVGYLISICISIPLGFLMAWYKGIRAFLDPFIQFLRCIPPIAYVPIVVAAMGVAEAPKYFIICLACTLTMTVTIYQGVKNVDLTLVKAAYTFGARDRNLFTGVIVPSAFPFILTAMRLGIGVAMTTLIAAELTGTIYGLGAFINTQASYLRMDYAVMGIIVLGICGIVLDKVLLAFEKLFTRWK